MVTVSGAEESAPPCEPVAGLLRDALPTVRVYEAGFVARAPQSLPPLFTTALRGALLRSLMSLSCRRGEGESCGGGVHRPGCPYPALAEARDGANHEVPAPFTLRPVAPAFSGRALALERGGRLAVRVAFIGDAGLEQVGLVRAALAGVAERGIGLKRRPGGRRPGLELESFARVAPVAGPGAGVTLHFETPCRLTVGGRPALEPSGAALWAAVVRRARLLSELYGQGVVPLPFEAPWRLEAVATRPVSVSRYSGRQKQRMTWSGFVGSARLVLGGDVALAAALLRFIEEVQVGKGTQFGFGAVRCSPGEPQA